MQKKFDEAINRAIAATYEKKFNVFLVNLKADLQDLVAATSSGDFTDANKRADVVRIIPYFTHVLGAECVGPQGQVWIYPHHRSIHGARMDRLELHRTKHVHFVSYYCRIPSSLSLSAKPATSPTTTLHAPKRLMHSATLTQPLVIWGSSAILLTMSRPNTCLSWSRSTRSTTSSPEFPPVQMSRYACFGAPAFMMLCIK